MIKRKYKYLILIILVFSFIFSACNEQPEHLEYNITIKVIAEDTNEAVNEAELKIENVDGNKITAKQTDEPGLYSFEKIKLEANADFQVEINKEGYENKTLTFTADSTNISLTGEEAIKLEVDDSDAPGDTEDFSGGSGTKEDPYLVENAAQLNNVRNYLESHFKQVDDIDLSDYSSGEGWKPIGEDFDNQFVGSYDGGDFKIKNLYIDRRVNLGLFGKLNEGALIKNINLEDVNINGNSIIGGLVGRNNKSKIKNCSVTGEISGGVSDDIDRSKAHVGGLVGMNYKSNIYNCYTDADIFGDSKIGGLVGNDYGSDMINNVAAGNVTGEGNYIGGLIGDNSGTVSNTLKQSYASGDVSGDENVGGLVGRSNYKKIEESFAIGAVSGNKNVGGLAGHIRQAKVKNSYSMGNVSGKINIGGFAGKLSGVINTEGLVKKSYSAGEVDGTSEVGGLIGFLEESSVVYSYYDKDNSGKDDTNKGIPKTTGELQEQETFEEWDFEDIWDIEENESYPYLSWQENNKPYPSN